MNNLKLWCNRAVRSVAVATQIFTQLGGFRDVNNCELVSAALV